MQTVADTLSRFIDHANKQFDKVGHELDDTVAQYKGYVRDLRADALAIKHTQDELIAGHQQPEKRFNVISDIITSTAECPGGSSPAPPW